MKIIMLDQGGDLIKYNQVEHQILLAKEKIDVPQII